jgi:2-polyprenyl-6-methoxyphenol hydroxylase-like FAD-dependent oxidoreductase
MADVDVLVAGAGPTGLTLALEMARRNHHVRIVDRQPAPFAGSRGKGLSARSQEVFDDLGIVDEVRAGGFRHLPYRIYLRGELVRDFDPHAERAPTPDMPYESGLIIPQWRTEQILRARLAEFGVTVEQATAVTGFSQPPDRVEVTLGTGEQVASGYLVGCDGGRSTIRKALGVRFDGDSGEQGMVLGDVAVEGLAPDRWYQWSHPERGFVALCPFPDSRSWQFQGVPLADIGPGGRFPEPSLVYYQRILDDIGMNPGVRLSSPTWLSTYRVNVRMVDRLRIGRVFLAGDAAHVHSPAGGLGMNTGIQDSYNLAWKLAAVLSGADDGLLETYQEERLPVAAWTLDTSSEGLRRVAEQFADEDSKGIAAGASKDGHQLAITYRFSSLSERSGGVTGGPVPGDRAPDAPCQSSTGSPVRLFDVFRGPHFTILGFGGTCAAALERLRRHYPHGVRCVLVGQPDEDGVDIFDHRGEARRAYQIRHDMLVLVRPDGYCAFTGEPTGESAVQDYLSRFHRQKP